MGLPLIINVDDPYADESSFHVAVDISDTYDRKVKMSSCHVSQVFEWLPWTNNEKAPTAESFAKSFLDRHRNVNKKYGMDDNIPREFFTFTKWGRLADEKDLEILFGSEVITGNAGKFIGTRQELTASITQLGKNGHPNTRRATARFGLRSKDSSGFQEHCSG